MNMLPTIDISAKKFFLGDTFYHFCNHTLKIARHLFVDCPFVQVLWFKLFFSRHTFDSLPLLLLLIMLLKDILTSLFLMIMFCSIF